MSRSSLAFLGDGDAISVCVAYLAARGIVSTGPSKIKVYDFDERMVGAINRFADHERLDNLRPSSTTVSIRFLVTASSSGSIRTRPGERATGDPV